MIFNKPTLITITAPTCSGKTYLIEHLEKMGLNRIVGFTTRAPRAGEIDGVSYHFISKAEATKLEKDGKLAETAEFRGNTYGVTHAEMEGKIDGEFPPVIILEPQGLKSYEKYCVEKGWDIFKVFVTVPEKTKIARLVERTAEDTKQAFENHLHNDGELTKQLAKIISSHSDRLMSITGEERLWQTLNTWDAIVPGDDIEKAIQMISNGIVWRNSK